MFKDPVMARIWKIWAVSLGILLVIWIGTPVAAYMGWIPGIWWP